MKGIVGYLVLVLLFSGLSSSEKYLLQKNGSDEELLVRVIKELAERGDISEKPLVVLDGVPYRYEVELKDARLPIKSEDVAKIQVIDYEMGMQIYGEYASGGVLLITTKSFEQEQDKESDK